MTKPRHARGDLAALQRWNAQAASRLGLGMHGGGAGGASVLAEAGRLDIGSDAVPARRGGGKGAAARAARRRGQGGSQRGGQSGSQIGGQSGSQIGGQFGT